MRENEKETHTHHWIDHLVSREIHISTLLSAWQSFARVSKQFKNLKAQQVTASTSFASISHRACLCVCWRIRNEFIQHSSVRFLWMWFANIHTYSSSECVEPHLKQTVWFLSSTNARAPPISTNCQPKYICIWFVQFQSWSIACFVRNDFRLCVASECERLVSYFCWAFNDYFALFIFSFSLIASSVSQRVCVEIYKKHKKFKQL